MHLELKKNCSYFTRLLSAHKTGKKKKKQACLQKITLQLFTKNAALITETSAQDVEHCGSTASAYFADPAMRSIKVGRQCLKL